MSKGEYSTTDAQCSEGGVNNENWETERTRSEVSKALQFFLGSVWGQLALGSLVLPLFYVLLLWDTLNTVADMCVVVPLATALCAFVFLFTYDLKHSLREYEWLRRIKKGWRPPLSVISVLAFSLALILALAVGFTLDSERTHGLVRVLLTIAFSLAFANITLSAMLMAIRSFDRKELEDWQASRRTRQATERRDNPYVANVPVSDPKMFFGRQEIRNQIVNGIHLNNFAICGPKRIGKTSLLHRLAAELRQMDDAPRSFFPVLLSLHGIPENRLFRTLMSAIVREYRSQTAPLTLRCRAEGEYNAYDFLDDLDIVQETLQQAIDKPLRLVLLVDEGDALNGYSQATLAQLRFVFMGPSLNYLKMVWSGEELDRRKWELHGSDWLTVFGDVFHLRPFTEEEATRLIVEPVPYYRYDKQAVRLILDHSQLIPHRIQLLCRGAVEEMLKAQRGRITVEDVEASIRHLAGETAPPGIQPLTISALAADSREQAAHRLAEGGAEYHTDEENEGAE